ncbi:MAG: GtrA family protein [Gammaproteobacteria bacterium]|nr:GtrA family protein [Gammaproteobacteria bacterium]
MLNKIINLPEIYRYIIAGSIAFASDMSSLYVLVEIFGFHYLVSNVFSYSIGLVVVYFLNIKWVFPVRKYSQISIEFSIFSIIAFTGLIISEILMWFTVEKYNLPYFHAKIIATAFVFGFNFLLRKILLFSR